jgi:hypothetical protein
MVARPPPRKIHTVCVGHSAEECGLWLAAGSLAMTERLMRAGRCNSNLRRAGIARAIVVDVALAGAVGADEFLRGALGLLATPCERSAGRCAAPS